MSPSSVGQVAQRADPKEVHLCCLRLEVSLRFSPYPRTRETTVINFCRSELPLIDLRFFPFTHNSVLFNCL